jgi:glycerol uptake facilitator-like aquaporin
MSRLLLGFICGLVFGALVVALMLPHKFPDKRAALIAAFLNRLVIGVIIGAVIGAPQIVQLGRPAWFVGLAVGFAVSAPDAVITRKYAPILVIGTIGGAVIGWIVGRWGV